MTDASKAATEAANKVAEALTDAREKIDVDAAVVQARTVQATAVQNAAVARAKIETGLDAALAAATPVISPHHPTCRLLQSVDDDEVEGRALRRPPRAKLVYTGPTM